MTMLTITGHVRHDCLFSRSISVAGVRPIDHILICCKAIRSEGHVASALTRVSASSQLGLGVTQASDRANRLPVVRVQDLVHRDVAQYL